jgi:hypothetical protein
MDLDAMISRRRVRAAIDVVFNDAERAVDKLLPKADLREAVLLKQQLILCRYLRRMLYTALGIVEGKKAKAKAAKKKAAESG